MHSDSPPVCKARPVPDTLFASGSGFLFAGAGADPSFPRDSESGPQGTPRNPNRLQLQGKDADEAGKGKDRSGSSLH